MSERMGRHGMGPRGTHMPGAPAASGPGVARLFVHEIGGCAFAAHHEVVWANLRPLSLLGPVGVFGGLLSMSL